MGACTSFASAWYIGLVCIRYTADRERAICSRTEIFGESLPYIHSALCCLTHWRWAHEKIHIRLPLVLRERKEGRESKWGRWQECWEVQGGGSGRGWRHREEDAVIILLTTIYTTCKHSIYFRIIYIVIMLSVYRSHSSTNTIAFTSRSPEAPTCKTLQESATLLGPSFSPARFPLPQHTHTRARERRHDTATYAFFMECE